MQSVKSAEYSLSEVIRQKVICLADCTDQETRFRVRMGHVHLEGDMYFSPSKVLFGSESSKED